MAGAPWLAGRGALRAGAGLVRVAVPASLAATVAAFQPELLTVGLPEARGALGARAVGRALALAEEADAVVLGPGAGRAAATGRALLELARRLSVPVVVDADALFALAAAPAALAGRTAPTVLTPHAGEAARLLGTTSRRVQSDRRGALDRLTQLTRATVVLKGPGTLVGAGSRRWRCREGDPILATGGTGDVLAGVVAALLAAAPERPFDAARRAVHWHALAGRVARPGGRARGAADRGMLASELADALPAALSRWRRA
jgi:NAD(P)H-hydrate epimerase